MVTLTQRDESSLLLLEGVVDIAGAGELKGILREALEGAKPVLVSMAEETTLDVTAVQLLWAAGREARAAGLKLTLEGAVPETVRAALSNAGFHEFSAAMAIK